MTLWQLSFFLTVVRMLLAFVGESILRECAQSGICFLTTVNMPICLAHYTTLKTELFHVAYHEQRA